MKSLFWAAICHADMGYFFESAEQKKLPDANHSVEQGVAELGQQKDQRKFQRSSSVLRTRQRHVEANQCVSPSRPLVLLFLRKIEQSKAECPI